MDNGEVVSMDFLMTVQKNNYFSLFYSSWCFFLIYILPRDVQNTVTQNRIRFVEIKWLFYYGKE